jgi:hypothetical protein
MKKVILTVCLIFAYTQISTAQIQFGVKGGLNYNSNSVEEVGEDLLDGAESKTGYHAGIWLRVKVPVIGFYIRPELVYTNLKSELVYNDNITSKSTNYNFQKIDVPVLLGKKIFGVGNIFIGPSFQFILDSEFSISEISGVETDNFSMGIQFGGGVELGKFGLDIRWERSFSGIESSFINNLGNSVDFDTRVSQIIIGLSYRL